MWAFLISGAQTTTKATSQLRDTNGRIGLGKTRRMFITFILKIILQKANIEKE